MQSREQVLDSQGQGRGQGLDAKDKDKTDIICNTFTCKDCDKYSAWRNNRKVHLCSAD